MIAPNPCEIPARILRSFARAGWLPRAAQPLPLSQAHRASPMNPTTDSNAAVAGSVDSGATITVSPVVRRTFSLTGPIRISIIRSRFCRCAPARRQAGRPRRGTLRGYRGAPCPVGRPGTAQMCRVFGGAQLLTQSVFGPTKGDGRMKLITLPVLQPLKKARYIICGVKGPHYIICARY
jgi:hypothetical protein